MSINYADNTNRVQNIRFGEDSDGHYMSLICPNASAYVLCFSDGKLLGLKDIRLTEQELKSLHDGGEVQHDQVRMKGVRRNQFHAGPVYRDFRVSPPEQIQVFSMRFNEYEGDYCLFIPEDPAEQTVYVPLHYRVTQRREGQYGVIRIDLDDYGNYRDGALMYQIGNSLPIPLAHEYLGREIRVRLQGEEPIKVIPQDKYAGKYIQTAGSGR